ncbi:hypothetical protein EUTSA_v10002457mg [Eutrema salsugineum]|uniref:Ion transport domain-containing protein n=1 Tax=Eutrema salsugineum TaxID=72664 RepID=V4LBD2_EUTSA|nr:hypothetical protein EUTSA_v10002457mg [Eutrema salsugineum]
MVYRNMKTLENWRKTVLLVCLAALAIDPLFLFIPVIDSHRFCFTFDKKLGAAACVVRTIIDTFYVIHIIFHIITEFIAPRLQVSLRGESFIYSKAIRERGLSFYFIVDIISVVPLPQIAVLTLIHRSGSLLSEERLKWIILSQYIPRIIRIYPVLKEVTRVSGTVTETKWIGAALNLFLYMLQSYVIGAFWYLSAIEKKNMCWSEACARTSGCNLSNLYCVRGGGDINSRFLNTSCPVMDPEQITNSTVFNFGMYTDALKSGVVESRDFPRKFVYCFWWGLRNLRLVYISNRKEKSMHLPRLSHTLIPSFNNYSALGQNLETSNSIGEIFFAITICVSGLLLFAVLIGNVQKYLQSSTTRIDEMEEKKRDTEKWMSSRMLPEHLKERIRRSEDYIWREARGTEEDSLLRRLPKNLRLETKRHIYQKVLKQLKRLPWLEDIDDRLLDVVCARLKTVIYAENDYIVREGEPIEDMLSSKFSIPYLYNKTIQALTEVEGFVLSADDVKFVTAQFYSREWQNWAACLIQAKWVNHCKRKLSKALREEEAKVHNTLQNDDSGGNTLNLCAPALRHLREIASRNYRFRQISLPEKPA